MGVGVSLGGLAGRRGGLRRHGVHLHRLTRAIGKPDFRHRPRRQPTCGPWRQEIDRAKELAQRRVGWWRSTPWWPPSSMPTRSAPRWRRGWTPSSRGAGLPLELPGLVGKATWPSPPSYPAPGRPGCILQAAGTKRYDRTADFVVIEGCKAGGHLGFSEEEACWPARAQP